MLAIAPLVGLFLLSTATVAVLLVKDVLERKTAPKGLSKTPKEGEVVKFVAIGDDWAAKVFREHRQFSVDVIHLGEFQVHRGGFGTIDAAEGFGVQYAKDHGATV